MKKLKSFFKKYWIESLLVACLASTFISPVVNIILIGGAIVTLLTRLIVIKV